MACLDQEGGKRCGDGSDADKRVEGRDELGQLCDPDLGSDGEAWHHQGMRGA